MRIIDRKIKMYEEAIANAEKTPDVGVFTVEFVSLLKRKLEQFKQERGGK